MNLRAVARARHVGRLVSSLSRSSSAAQTGAAEIGQEGMMQATLDLYGQLTEIHEQVGRYRTVSQEEQAAADAYAKKQLGN